MLAQGLVIRSSRQAVAYVTGELDIATAPRTRQALIDPTHRDERVIIDLGRFRVGSRVVQHRPLPGTAPAGG
ncbi:hypothetical protein ACFQ71_38760 [Streptomyces sp. NPDC056534]|uniref:hypothetical protein n=1 Tax=Streptomyces sp. NPDC056534 TaxID=3345857 RepID=UPI0036B9BD69